jgi:ABC-type amino acid transport substrate-binding protein
MKIYLRPALLSLICSALVAGQALAATPPAAPVTPSPPAAQTPSTPAAVNPTASPVLSRVKTAGAVRVCIWPDYYGITWRNPRTEQLTGIDVELSAEFARSLGVKLQYVETSFSKLIEDVTADRCDVAMFGVGITAPRQQALKFSQPYMRSSLYAIANRGSRVVRQWGDIDQPGVRVAVLAGTWMEPLMKTTTRQAELVVIRSPQTREQELEAGRVDVFMTDYPYSRRLLDNADWAKLLSPPQEFHPLAYAYAVKPGDEAWLRTVDDFVAQIKRDGRLDAAGRRAGLTEIILRQ